MQVLLPRSIWCLCSWALYRVPWRVRAQECLSFLISTVGSMTSLAYVGVGEEVGSNTLALSFVCLGFCYFSVCFEAVSHVDQGGLELTCLCLQGTRIK